IGDRLVEIPLGVMATPGWTLVKVTEAVAAAALTLPNRSRASPAGMVMPTVPLPAGSTVTVHTVGPPLTAPTEPLLAVACRLASAFEAVTVKTIGEMPVPVPLGGIERM